MSNEYRSPANLEALYKHIQQLLGDPVGRATEKLIGEVETIVNTRQLYKKGVLRIDPYAEHIRRLIENNNLTEQFKHELADYEAQWNTARYSSGGLGRKKGILHMLNKHPFVLKGQGIHAAPLAVMMDIANQSDLGIYTQKEAALKPADQLDTAFITLAQNRYWKQMMGKHAVNMAERFSTQGRPMDLVMIGDGNGELGASMAQALVDANADFRMIHMDVGEGMLKQQKTTYMEQGLPMDRIFEIRGSVLKDVHKIRQAVPEFNGGFFVLHEILDSLRTHAVYSDQSGLREVYQVIDPSLKQNLEAFEPSHPLVQHAGEYLPFYKPVNGIARMIPFSPLGVSCMREILESGDQVAMYIGDYAGQFVMGEKAPQAYKELPIRTYGRDVEGTHDYTSVFERPVDMTADVLPGIVHLSALYGGTVETLTTQEEYIGRVDPTLSARVDSQLRAIQNRAQQQRYKQADIPQLLDDSVFVTELCSPHFFAAEVTKGM